MRKTDCSCINVFLKPLKPDTEEDEGPMNALTYAVLLFSLVAVGCAHTSDPAFYPPLSIAAPEVRSAIVASNSEPLAVELAARQAVPSEGKKADDYDETEDLRIVGAEGKVEIADPLEPFNRTMYHFNDKLYFWLLKPLAQGYQKVVPEVARIGVNNFFTNLAFPVRFVNSLLQADFSGATTELGRFLLNTFCGMGGLFDPASHEEIDLTKQERDLGQTLGSYGLEQGIFINWPILGPSTPRDTVGMVGDLFLHPLTYINPWYDGTAAKGSEKVNNASFKIGDYESLKEAAIDPYVAIRDAYVQYRMNMVKKASLDK